MKALKPRIFINSQHKGRSTMITFYDRTDSSPMVWETEVQSQVGSYQRLKKMVLDAALLNTQHYKVSIKGKVMQSRERSNTLLYITV